MRVEDNFLNAKLWLLNGTYWFCNNNKKQTLAPRESQRRQRLMIFVFQYCLSPLPKNFHATFLRCCKHFEFKQPAEPVLKPMRAGSGLSSCTSHTEHLQMSSTVVRLITWCHGPTWNWLSSGSPSETKTQTKFSGWSGNLFSSTLYPMHLFACQFCFIPFRCDKSYLWIQLYAMSYESSKIIKSRGGKTGSWASLTQFPSIL